MPGHLNGAACSLQPEKKLWSACEDGDTTTAQEALENGVDVNWENPQARVRIVFIVPYAYLGD